VHPHIPLNGFFFIYLTEVRLAQSQLADTISFSVLVMEAVGVTHESWVGLHYDLHYQLDEDDNRDTKQFSPSAQARIAHDH
jgi:hypothetical protein